ncbi:MAG: cytochrome c [Acidobacteriia bacterium]|nr:cytochrome c [Terriglobia bacterium]
MLGICMGLGLLSLGFVYVKWPPHKVAANPVQQLLLFSTQKKFASMPLLMSTGMQQEYDFLSSAMSLKSSLDERKMNSISTAAGRMNNLARELGSYEQDLKKAGKSSEDIRFFREAVLNLDRFAQDLQDAALRQDPARMNTAFKQVEQTCSQCHLRFGVKGAKKAISK